MNKHIRLVLILAILICFPILSILFLYYGYNDRLADQTAMDHHMELRATAFSLQDGTPWHTDSLLGQACIAAFDVPAEQIVRLDQQFGRTPDCTILYVSDQLPETISEAEYSRLLTIDRNTAFITALLDSFPGASTYCTPEKCSGYFLVDYKNKIRNFYRTTDEGEMKQLVKQTAILLAKPRKFDRAELIRKAEK